MYERTSTTTCGCNGLSVNNPVTNKYQSEPDFGKEEDIVQAVYGEDNGYIKKDVGDMVSMNSSWSSSEEKIRPQVSSHPEPFSFWYQVLWLWIPYLLWSDSCIMRYVRNTFIRLWQPPSTPEEWTNCMISSLSSGIARILLLSLTKSLLDLVP